MISVLLVDDDPGILDLTRLFFEREPSILVKCCGSAISALALLDTEWFDVIVADYGMPEMDGITFLKQLNARGSTTPVIIFTGKSREEVVIEALNNGAAFYLPKGGDILIQFTELKNMVMRAAQMGRSEKARAHLASIVTSSDDAIFATNLDGTIISWNRSAETMYGQGEAEALGRPVSDLFPPEARALLTEKKGLVDSGEVANHYETEGVTRTGKKFECSVTISPVRDEKERLSGISYIVRDLTTQREMERALVSYITESALRLKNPVELVSIRLQEITDQIISHQFTDEEIRLQMMTQVKNIKQIVTNLRQLNQAIVEGQKSVPESYRKFLSQ